MSFGTYDNEKIRRDYEEKERCARSPIAEFNAAGFRATETVSIEKVATATGEGEVTYPFFKSRRIRSMKQGQGASISRTRSSMRFRSPSIFSSTCSSPCRDSRSSGIVATSLRKFFPAAKMRLPRFP